MSSTTVVGARTLVASLVAPRRSAGARGRVTRVAAAADEQRETTRETATLQLAGLKERTRGSLVQQVPPHPHPLALATKPAPLCRRSIGSLASDTLTWRGTHTERHAASLRGTIRPLRGLEARAQRGTHKRLACGGEADAGGDEGRHGAATNHRAVGDQGACVGSPHAARTPRTTLTQSVTTSPTHQLAV